jgi:predicted alpha/beta-hydrolase family hydrolase
VVAGVVLFPGAGSSADHPSMRAMETALAPMPVALVDFPYRRAGRRFPDPARVLAARLGVSTSRLVIGGRSMGGRMCSMAVADGLAVAGLVLVAYPLHPPKHPDRLRVEHLPRLAVASLWISGTRDEFGAPDELAEAHALPSVAPDVAWVDGARHALTGRNDEVAAIVATWVGSR